MKEERWGVRSTRNRRSVRAVHLSLLTAALATGALAWLVLSLGPGPRPPWKITHRVAAHRALVVEVEASRPEDAVAIARQISEPEQSRFGEILVFINPPGKRDMLRRVQWTPGAGYVETVYRP